MSEMRWPTRAHVVATVILFVGGCSGHVACAIISRFHWTWNALGFLALFSALAAACGLYLMAAIYVRLPLPGSWRQK